MNKFLEFLKQNVKVAITITAMGSALTAGLTQKGCSVDVAPASAPPATQAPAVPVAPAVP